MQDDDAEANTVKGRSGLVLTEAPYTLGSKIRYGVDGNTITASNMRVLSFAPLANKTYAFVYTKTASTTTTNKYQAVTKPLTDDHGTTEVVENSVNGLYRYKLVEATANEDAKKGVTYFENSNASANAITAFLGQNVDNLFTRTGGSGTDADPYTYAPAKGYAQTGTTYYYTLDGQTYTEAYSVPYAAFGSTTLYKDNAGSTTKTETTPADGQAYYYNDGGTYKYCVIYPQRTSWDESGNTKHLYVFNGTDTTVDANFVACGTTDVAVKGMTYFDKYTKNNGVYYVKVIKVE